MSADKKGLAAKGEDHLVRSEMEHLEAVSFNIGCWRPEHPFIPTPWKPTRRVYQLKEGNSTEDIKKKRAYLVKND